MQIHNITQRTDSWFKARAGRITASNFHRVVTDSGKRASATAWESLALELIGQCVRPDEIQWEGNFHTDRGETLEPEARETFARQLPSSCTVEEIGFITHDTNTILGCSPDGIIVHDNGDYVAGLEIKSPLSKHHLKYLLDNKVPSQYMAQVHGSMIVSSLNVWYFMSYCPGFKPLIVRAVRDEYTAWLEDELTEFTMYYSQRYNDVMPRILIKN